MRVRSSSVERSGWRMSKLAPSLGSIFTYAYALGVQGSWFSCHQICDVHVEYELKITSS